MISHVPLLATEHLLAVERLRRWQSDNVDKPVFPFTIHIFLSKFNSFACTGLPRIPVVNDATGRSPTASTAVFYFATLGSVRRVPYKSQIQAAIVGRKKQHGAAQMRISAVMAHAASCSVAERIDVLSRATPAPAILARDPVSRRVSVEVSLKWWGAMRRLGIAVKYVGLSYHAVSTRAPRCGNGGFSFYLFICTY